MTPDLMSKFGRRITSWLVYFYRNDDQDLKYLTPAIEKLAEKFKGILEVMRVNCDQEGDFCRELMVY